MADFVRIKEQNLWINLDYVVRIEPNADEAGGTVVVFADGTSFAISDADGKRLLKRLRPPKKVEEDKSPTVAFADGTSFRISDADGKRLRKKMQPPKKKKKKKKRKPVVEAPEVAEAAPETAVEGGESALPVE